MEDACIIDRCPDQPCTLPLTDEMPGYDIGMVFHDGKDDLVALTYIGHAPAIRHRVDRRGGVGGEHDILHARRIQEATDGFACLFISICSRGGEEVEAAMDIRIFLAIGVRYGIQHCLRLLRRRAIVQIDQRLAVDFARQDWKIATNCLDVVGRGYDLLVHRLPFKCSSGRAFTPSTMMRAVPSRARTDDSAGTPVQP